MLVPVFTLDLKQKILPGRVCIGKYDSAHACLTASTTADKVNRAADFGLKNIEEMSLC